MLCEWCESAPATTEVQTGYDPAAMRGCHAAVCEACYSATDEAARDRRDRDIRDAAGQLGITERYVVVDGGYGVHPRADEIKALAGVRICQTDSPYRTPEVVVGV